MSTTHRSYSLTTTTELGFAAAVARVREQLSREGFGVLAEIDVQATLTAKLGVDREPYLILGACNPTLAHAALEAEPELGVLLPCNVIVYEQNAQTHIAAVDAERMLLADEFVSARHGSRRHWSGRPGQSWPFQGAV